MTVYNCNPAEAFVVPSCLFQMQHTGSSTIVGGLAQKCTKVLVLGTRFPHCVEQNVHTSKSVCSYKYYPVPQALFVLGSSCCSNYVLLIEYV